MPNRLRMIAVIIIFSALGRAHAQLSFGPYVQNTGDKRAVVIWYTQTAETGFVRYGRQMGQWEGTMQTPASQVHRLEAFNLQPNTKYFYEIGSGAKIHAAGESYYFRTHPRPGTNVPFRFMAFGDFGTGDENQRAVAAQLRKDDSRHEFALLLGDLIYSQGEREKYLANYFPVYQDLIRHRPWWPTLGNHDIKTENGAAYFEFFETPANNPLAVENYYSFDYANAHFASLDGELLFDNAADRQRQLDWLRQDLRAAKGRGQRWMIAMWHRPPYSGGSHDDDDDIRREFVPVIEAEGVDLVLSGHSHVAERSFMLSNHQVLNRSPAQYSKVGFEKGTVYVVSGAGGEIYPIKTRHSLMAFQRGEVCGYESIYIHGDSLKGSWITDRGEIQDHFSLIKSGSATTVEMIEDTGMPQAFAQHYPNPFHVSHPEEELRIVFEIAAPAPVTAVIFVVVGRVVAWLSDGALFAAGTYLLRWIWQKREGGRAKAGVYFYRVHAGARVHSAKFLILP